MNKLTESDLFFLERAIHLAALPVGAVSPNPYVGAVIVKDGQIIGEGFHAKAGTAHAEVVAIQNASKHTQGATIYVSLEPCCHYGRTGPCTEAILNAGITRVVYATQDPNPTVAGKGEAFLVSHGIETVCVHSIESQWLNRIFFYNQQYQFTYVTLKAGMSLDGKIASKTGDSQWITGKDARLKAHELRAKHDAIMIGKRTLLNDDPSLTVRIPDQNYSNPIRILLLRNFNHLHSTDYQLFDTSLASTWVIYPSQQTPNEQLYNELQAKNVRLMPLNSKEVNIEEVTALLYENGIMSLLLEGGSSIYNAFLTERRVQECALFYGPRLIGDQQAPSLWDHSNVQSLSDAPILTIKESEQMGDSLYVCATFKEVE